MWGDVGVPDVLGPVRLRDQFGESNHLLFGLDFFAIPVDKNQEGISDPRAHLSWWRLGTGTEFQPRRVVVQNQFGDYTLDVFEPQYLLNPALKNSGGATIGLEQIDPLPDDTHDHYKCYRVEGESVGAPVVLAEQYGVFTDTALDPLYLCNPTEKTDPAGNVFPIKKPEEHLVCYQMQLPTPIRVNVSIADQFGSWFAGIEERKMLCVPSLKDEVVQTLDETWGGLKSIYR